LCGPPGTCDIETGFNDPPTCLSAPCSTPRYYSSSGSCELCPLGCVTCTDPTTCQSCSPSYYQIGTECIKCPKGTYLATPTTCLACSAHCIACIDSLTCQVCNPGYELYSGYCRLCPPGMYLNDDQVCQKLSETLQDTLTGSQLATSGATQAANMISEGSSISLSAAVSGRIFSQIKYLNISYSGELEMALLTWLPSFVSLGLTPDMPPSFIDKFPERHVPYVFEKYKVPSSFLINIWESLGIIVFVTVLWLLSKLIQHLVSPTDNPLTAKIARKARVMIQNFLVGALYGVYGDLVLFSIIEYRTLVIGWDLSLLSWIISVILIVIMLLTFIYQVKLLLSYQKIKKQSTEMLEKFIKDQEGNQVIFKDFKDYSIGPQLFLFFLSGRDLLFSLLLATMFEYPLAQTILITILYGLMIAYLFIKRPFESSFDFGQQLFFELVGIAVNICVCINAILDAGDYQAVQARKNIGKFVIICNLLFNFVTAGFMVYTIGHTLYDFYKSRQAKRVKKLETLTISNRLPKLSSQETNQNQNSYSNVNTSIIHNSQSVVYDDNLINQTHHSEIISFQQPPNIDLLDLQVQSPQKHNKPRKARNLNHEQQVSSLNRGHMRQRNNINDNQIELDSFSQLRKVNKSSSQINQRR